MIGRELTRVMLDNVCIIMVHVYGSCPHYGISRVIFHSVDTTYLLN